jgi:hypothetical protein
MKSMLDMLKRPALAIVGASANRPDREKLKAAIAARQTAQQAVVVSHETVERLATVIRTSDDAARLAADAANRATEAHREWVRNGCKHSESRELQALDDAAAQAARAAEAAGRDADVVKKTRTLAHAQSALQSAETDVRHSENTITGAIGEIIAEEAATLLDQFERAAKEYRVLRLQVKALQRVVAPDIYGNHAAKSEAGAQIVVAALVRAAILSWDDERSSADAHDFVEGTLGRDAGMLEQASAPWLERAAQLRADADSDA